MREYFKRLVNELDDLRKLETDEDSFLSKYYKKIESLLELSQFETDRSCKYYYQNTYNRFKSKYLQFWSKKLHPYRLGECTKSTLEELRIGRDYFSEFQQILNRIPSLKQTLGTNKIAFLRSNQYAVDALILMKERGDPEQIIRNWQKAGEVCKSEKQSPMPEDFELLAEGESCYAQKYKLQAFYCIEGQPKNYHEVISNLEKSRVHAANALSFYQQAGNSILKTNISKHISYIDYWKSLFVSRQSLLDKNFEKSKSSIKEAITHAKIIDPKAKRIFPNRFCNFQDLENEENFIQACEALTKADLYSCSNSLKTWLEQSDKLRGTWRYINIALRKEAIECLIHRYVSKDDNAFLNAKNRLKEKISSRPQVGSHTRSIINIIERGFATTEGVCAELYVVFPLDTYPSDIYKNTSFELTKDEKLQQLPSCAG